jgi:hypothetical protein
MKSIPFMGECEFTWYFFLTIAAVGVGLVRKVASCLSRTICS